MAEELIPLAIAYDFDGTLAAGNMQEHSFLPEIGIKPKRFWAEVRKCAAENDMDQILAYMHLMLKHAQAKDVSIRRSSFVRHGAEIEFFPGVKKWFKLINKFANKHGVNIQHYIISSGLRELVEGTPLAKEFTYIFASGFMYDQDQIARWPALAVNYTNKTQYLFRINKGILNSHNNDRINKFIPEDDRPVPFTNMVYIGDGETDVPSMKMVKYKGGHAIAVYDPKKRKTSKSPSPKSIAQKLITEDRADYAVAADYSKGQQLDQIVKSIIEATALNYKLKGLQK